MIEGKDNEIRNITEKYETTINKLKADLIDGSQRIQILRTENVNVYFVDYFTKCIKYFINV